MEAGGGGGGGVGDGGGGMERGDVRSGRFTDPQGREGAAVSASPRPRRPAPSASARPPGEGRRRKGGGAHRCVKTLATPLRA